MEGASGGPRISPRPGNPVDMVVNHVLEIDESGRMTLNPLPLHPKTKGMIETIPELAAVSLGGRSERWPSVEAQVMRK
jgi:hypothetical protein